MALVDTAEMYGDGGAEEVAGDALAGRRDGVFLVSKVYPHNASRSGVVAACERSLKRLRVAAIDLYLLHWRGRFPLAETVEGFEALRRDGKVRHWGVSNLDTDDMAELADVPGGKQVACDQVIYNLSRRGIEFDLLPWCRKRSVPVMAYSPIEQGRILDHKALAAVAKRRGVSPAQVALSWVMRADGVIAIPKSASAKHLAENRAAHDLALAAEDLAELDRAFAPPRRKEPLGIL
jgi:diketogulonate reductase-like aldo/keto reductase